MAVISSFGFEDAQRRFKQVDLLHPERPRIGRYETTLITGQNGSHKSTLLKHLVTSLVSPPKPDLFSTERNVLLNPQRHQVFCLSGSAADRFPSKEFPQGMRSGFDVPFYTYVGQRVGNNLLSRKAPLETMLAFALQARATERCGWRFFSDAHKHAGIYSSAKYTLVYRGTRESRDSLQTLRGSLGAITPATDDARHSKRPFPNVSYAVAQWLLSEFSAEDFSALRDLLLRRARFDVVLSGSGAISEDAKPNVLRLGLLLDILRLQEVQVRSSLHGTEFSAFELSSGEYHMFATILAVGFGLDEESVLLMDEPENSLHPQWQRDLMETVFSTCSQVMSNGHAIISTHSPLIVGSASQGSTVVDMTRDEPQVSVVAYGASSDELLLSQFGVGSSRNRVVVDRVQLAVSLVERGDFASPQFQALVPELLTIREALTSSDPLVEVIDALMGERLVQ